MALDDGSEIAELARPFYVRLLEIAWNDAADAGFVDGAFDVENEEVQEILQDLTFAITRVAKHTQERVRELVGEASANGWGVDELAARFEAAGSFNRKRAETVANTELADAYSRGSILAWQRSGVVEGMEWLVTNPCPECDELAGKIVPLGSEFAPGVKHPPRHTDCFCAVAPVVSDL